MLTLPPRLCPECKRDLAPSIAVLGEDAYDVHLAMHRSLRLAKNYLLCREALIQLVAAAEQAGLDGDALRFARYALEQTPPTDDAP